MYVGCIGSVGADLSVGSSPCRRGNDEPLKYHVNIYDVTLANRRTTCEFMLSLC